VKVMEVFARIPLIFRLAIRSLWAHRIKSAIVGSLMVFGTVLVISGTAMLDSIESAMSRSIIHSLAGHLQIYSANARDELAIYGGTTMGGLDYGEIPSFADVKAIAETVDNIKAVVPMGINVASMSRGSELDLAFGRLRVAHQQGKAEDQEQLIPAIKRLLLILRNDLKNQVSVTSGSRHEEVKAQLKHVAASLTDTFWADYRQNPLKMLEFLDTKVAPAGGDGRLMYLRYVGTDLTAFAKHFDRFQVVKGEAVPKGKRGILINQNFADKRLKILAARLLDSLEKARKEEVLIAGNAELESKARRLKTQTGAISILLSPQSVRLLRPLLKAETHSQSDDFDVILGDFLSINDSNLTTRYKTFYALIAPKLDLYPFKIGDVVTIRAWTKSGYSRAANVTVYGTFSFRGLERSDLSGAANLVDMITFRELYGQMSSAQRLELSSIRKSAKVKSVSRKTAENALFGGADTAADDEDEVGGRFSEFDGIDLKKTRRSNDERSYTQADIEHGMTLSIAVLLKDEDKLPETQAALQAALKKANLKLKVVDWKTASGLIGQFVQLVRAVLYFAIFTIFMVALVIINNSMLMATLERVREIGTMRAIGAQRGLILSLMVTETFVLCSVAGTLGTALGTGLISWLNTQGIPATTDVMVFLFSGPRLFPDYTSQHVWMANTIIVVVSLLATLWPARVATRVQPIEAMRSAD
jgi:ABC-type lipoprotein release transport system permease subunit